MVTVWSSQSLESVALEALSCDQFELRMTTVVVDEGLEEVNEFFAEVN